MRIPNWTNEAYPQDPALLAAILARRGGSLLNLDKALLWSEPVARGWQVYLKAVRTELSVSRQLRELAICTVALLTGADYEYHHHAPDYLAAGGEPSKLDALKLYAQAFGTGNITAPNNIALSSLESLVIHYAAQMTKNIKVDVAVFAPLAKQLTTTELVELTSAIATYNMVARFLVALDINPEKNV